MILFLTVGATSAAVAQEADPVPTYLRDRGTGVATSIEAVVPHHAEKPLIGTAGWELKLGTGVTRGFSWGTLTARAAIEYAESRRTDSALPSP